MKEFDILAENAKIDENAMNDLISKNESFILRCASSIACNYVSKSDNEWFVALAAFSQAVNEYSVEMGSFLNFAELSMRRSVLDFINSQSRYADENSINFSTLYSESSESSESLELSEPSKSTKTMKTLILHGLEKEVDNAIKLEIELANDVLSSYGFTFFDLINCSPKSKRAKKLCVRAVSYMMKNPILISNMKVRKSLQMNTIQKNAKLPKNILVHYEKYIITVVEIISGDYRCLSEYIRFIREGLKDESCSCWNKR